METVFRVIRFRPPGNDKDIILITNVLNVRAEQVAIWYRRRWDIEVFFRFLKQELNFSHFVSLNENGIQIVLYMTLIAAMLIMIYKNENAVGYKTAKRRMEIELQDIILAVAVARAGGDLSRLNLPVP
ncbi:MAG: transposase [Odoribacteraceae bacterium]|nr:transposase [Odoribacteraceae bacterium]